MLESVSSGVVSDASHTLGHAHTHSQLPDSPSSGIHPFLPFFYLAATCICLMMAYYLESNRRSSKTGQKTTQSETRTVKGDTGSIMVSPGEWFRPLGNIEILHEVAGWYGSHNTIQVLWLSSKQPIIPNDVRQALCLVAEKNLLLQACVQRRGMRPWFKRMDHVAVEFEVEEEDTMAAYYTEVQKSYNMKKGPLWRAKLVTIPQKSSEDPHRSALILSIHHIITDGHTNVVISRDILEVLNASMTGGVHDLPIRSMTPALSDTLVSKKDWYYICRYFWLKVYKLLIKDYSILTYFNGVLPQPQTKVALTKMLRENFSIEETKELLRHCKERGVTVNSCIMATANLAFFQTVQQRAGNRVEVALISSVNCIDMRRYFPDEVKESLGSHISFDENEILIPDSAANSKEHFWSLANVFQKNLHSSINVEYNPIIISPLFRPLTLIFHINYALTCLGWRNRTDNHILSTNMGNLKHRLPGKYNGPVEITEYLRSGSGQFSGNLLTLCSHTFTDQFMVSMDYYTNKMTDDTAKQFFSNFTTCIGNIAKYGMVQEPLPSLNGSLAEVN